MAVWTIVVMAVLLLAIGIFVILTFLTEYGNKKKQQANLLYPFSGYLSPPSPPWTVSQNKNNPGVGGQPEDGLYLVGMVGGSQTTVPQIQCPAGYKINIVGAFLDIVDPYGECSNTADSRLEATCGSSNNTSSSPSCQGDDDCGAGMICYSGKCTPMKCSINSDCGGSSAQGVINTCSDNLGKACSTQANCGSGLACVKGKCEVDPGSGSCMACVGGYCSSMPTCIGVSNGLNTTCSPSSGDSYHCRPRDASAYLAAHCDGKSYCLADPNDIWNPNQPGGPFGTLPCHISASSTSDEYPTLPVITGWGGGSPNNSQSGQDTPATFNQGYYVHGIYTCVPDNENALTS